MTICCVACREALQSEPSNGRCAAVFAVEGGSLECEHCAAGDGPGPVSDAEVLNFLVFDPPFSDGTMTPEGLVQLDRGGLSTLRSMADNAEFKVTYAQMTDDRPDRQFVGVAQFTASTLRYHENCRFVGIYDTPLPEKPHHADILGPHIPDIPSKTAAEKARKKRIRKLIEAIGPSAIVMPTAFRDGLLLANDNHNNS